MYSKDTLSKHISALEGVTDKAEVVFDEIFGSTDISWNMTCISIKDCLISRYTEPRNPKGTESWKRRPLTITRFPTLILPARIS